MRRPWPFRTREGNIMVFTTGFASGFNMADSVYQNELKKIRES